MDRMMNTFYIKEEKKNILHKIGRKPLIGYVALSMHLFYENCNSNFNIFQSDDYETKLINASSKLQNDYINCLIHMTNADAEYCNFHIFF